MSNSQTRLKEYEALRGLSILLLMALHSEVFDPQIFGNTLRDIGVFVASFLLGSFFFLAGYFTEVSLSKSGATAWKFIWSKFIRIYPPYWIALVLFIYVLGYDLSRSGLAVYALNLQAVFSPTFVKALLTLWYISMLVVFYMIYGSMMLTIRSTKALLIGSLVVFGVALWAHISIGLFDARFFQYYFIFLAGVLFCRYEDIRIRSFDLNIWIKLFIAVIGVAFFQWVIRVENAMKPILFVVAADVFILGWILLALTIFRTKLGDWRVWAWLSTASFFAYLVHRPLWHMMDVLLDIEAGFDRVWIHILPGALIALVLGYFLQLGYDRLLAALRLK